MNYTKTFAILGVLFAFLGVALGAFGAHALSANFQAYPARQSNYQTAAQYQMYHALALFAVAWANDRWSQRLLIWAGFLLSAGIILFSGSLYLLSITGSSWLGAITPLGGVAFLAGWAWLGMGIWRGTYQMTNDE